MKKRFLSALLAVLLCVGLASTTAYAGSGFSDATSISFGTTYEGVIDAEKEDYYKFTLPSSGRILVTTSSTKGTTDAWAKLYHMSGLSGNSLGSLRFPFYNGGEISQTSDLTQGEYCIVIYGNYFSKGINYSLRVEFFSANESFEETTGGTDNSLETANEISLDESYRGSIAINDDRDFYKFTVPSSGKINFTATSAANYIYYYFYSASGTELWRKKPNWNSVAGQGVTNETVTLSPGTCYLAVVQDRYSGSNTGNYEFRISDAVVKATGVTVSKSSLALTEGDSAALTAAVSPRDATNQTVSWSSSDSSVATVDVNGRVSAVAPGTATITATTEDGGYTAQCRVTVEDRVQNVRGVSLSESTLTLTEGDSARLTADVSPRDATNQAVSWSSSDSSVARVDANGRVTAVSPGTATITVTTEDGGYTARCHVTVEDRVQNVRGVSLSESTLTLTEGDSARLTADVSPRDATNQAVSWSSSDSSVARVDANGRVTAVSPGTATITVTTEDGGYTARCHVTVENRVQRVVGVSLSETSLTLTEGDSARLTADVSPRDATNQAVSWSSSDSSVARVDADGRVTAVSPGTATIIVTTEDGDFNSKCRVTVEKKTGDSHVTPSDVHFPRNNVYYQDQFTDVPANQWYTDNVADAFEFGLMVGDSPTTFDPYGNVTIAQTVTMAARIHSIYTRGYEDFQQTGDKWYQVYMDYAYENKIISLAYYNSDVSQKASRAQFAEIFANSMPADGLSAINNVADGAIPDVSMENRYAEYIYKLYRAGILAGSDANGTFNPTTYITRAEAAAIISRMAESNNRISITLQ